MGMLHNLADLIKIKKDKMTILVLGLNNSGKSSIINHFKKSSEQTSIVVPTVGFMVEQFYIGMSGVSIKAIDMSGATRYRNLWEHQFKNCHGIIYVIDSSDRMRFVVVKDELDLVLQHPDLCNRIVPILFYGNKMDMEDSLSSVKIAAALRLENIKDKPWHICSSSAISGEGLGEGVQWLIQQMRFAMLNNKNAAKSRSKHSK
uniref:ADP-ribosylation factor-like protein 6 n=1 Tax=Drosophila melanogaster TaxID=7227 RepID=A1ZBK9_DROME|nr:ADP ribosylation factor-like 6, isoform A [Drosophila melanogaster]AAF57559.1 ADP ribosylation factor-like 6, isoform A [Drosophila melanogaster]|eukprot:NP_611421.1 ADP ribosylation factor-like 6, isoform A [Drosophila melanogaster]